MKTTAIVCKKCRAQTRVRNPEHKHCSRCRQDIKKCEKMRQETVIRRKMAEAVEAGLSVEDVPLIFCKTGCGRLITGKGKTGACHPCTVAKLASMRGESWRERISQAFRERPDLKRKCMQCGDTFLTKTIQKQFCTPACNIKNWRARQYVRGRRGNAEMQWSELAPAFWANVRKGRSCWYWEGPVSSNGHGLATFEGIREHAHRVAYRITYGHVPDGVGVQRACGNPKCVNPEHLRMRLTTTQKKAVVREYLRGGITQEALAKRVGISRETVSRLVGEFQDQVREMA